MTRAGLPGLSRRSLVGRLRKKIGPDRIETVRGLGYRLAAPEGEPTDE